QLHCLSSFFDQSNDVAHSENPPRKPLWNKKLKLIELFTCACEFDRSVRDFAHGQCRAAPRVSVKFRKNNSCDGQSSIKAAGYTHRLLPCRRIGNEQNFVRPQKFFERLEFIHKRFIDFLPPGSIEDADKRTISRERGYCGRIKRGPAGTPCSKLRRCRRGDTLHIFLPRVRNMNRDVYLFSKRCELFDRRRPLQITSHQRRHATLLL